MYLVGAALHMDPKGKKYRVPLWNNNIQMYIKHYKLNFLNTYVWIWASDSMPSSFHIVVLLSSFPFFWGGGGAQGNGDIGT